MYTPTKLFERIQALEWRYKVQRELDPDLRTQMRIGTVDIELHTKKVGREWERQDPQLYGWIPEPNLTKEVNSPPVGRSAQKRDRSESQSLNQTGKKVLNFEEINLDETVWGDAVESEDRGYEKGGAGGKVNRDEKEESEKEVPVRVE